jgi:hypothetical protein
MQSNDTQEDNYDQLWERIPQEFRFLFFRMPVLRSDAAFYRGLTIRLANTIGPQDLREWLLVKDIVDHTCYILFLRRVEMNMIDLATREALIVILTALSHGELADKVKHLAKGWFCGSETKKLVEKLFHDYGLAPVHIEAEAVRLRTDELAQTERMMASRELRLREAFRDLDFYRESKRINEELKGVSGPKGLRVVPPSELPDSKHEPAQDGAVSESANDGPGLSPGAFGSIAQPSGAGSGPVPNMVSERGPQ